MLLPIIDLGETTAMEQFCKVDEEFSELLDEMNCGDMTQERRIEECLDLIQASVQLFEILCYHSKDTMDDNVYKHYNKLIQRSLNGTIKFNPKWSDDVIELVEYRRINND